MSGDIPMIHGYEEQHGDERGNDKFDEVTWAELVRLREETRWHVELRITTRCPSCGHQSLFIGKGGHLTCSWLECKEPGLERAIEKLASEPSAPKLRVLLADAWWDGALYTGERSCHAMKQACDAMLREKVAQEEPTQANLKGLIERLRTIASHQGCHGPFDENCYEYPDKLEDWCAPCVMGAAHKALESLSSSPRVRDHDVLHERAWAEAERLYAAGYIPIDSRQAVVNVVVAVGLEALSSSAPVEDFDPNERVKMPVKTVTAYLPRVTKVVRATPRIPRDEESAETPIIAAILADYPDELDKAACDRCEHCSPIVMCSFHSVLSMLQAYTTPTSLLGPAETQEDERDGIELALTRGVQFGLLDGRSLDVLAIRQWIVEATEQIMSRHDEAQPSPETPAPLTAEDEALIDKGWETLKAADIAAKGSPRDIIRAAFDPFHEARKEGEQ